MRGMDENRKDLEPLEKDRLEEEKKKAYIDILNLMSLVGFFYGALDDRLDFDEALAQQLKKPAPRYGTRLEGNLLACLGGLSFILILIQILTGVLLLFYYRPTIGQAYDSVMEITNRVPFGWLIRGLHVWGSSLLIVMVFLHMLRVFLTGAYKPPRELTWVSGVFLLLITLGFGFSGYLLPWNQLSYWATTVGTEGITAIPIIGETLKHIVRGGTEVGQIALTRFFAMHVVVLPGITMIFLAIHFLMVRRLGIADPL